MLKTHNLIKDFGGLRAVDHCSFEVAPEGIYGLIGPNGSGKSTVFNLITGFYQLDGGEVHFDGELLNGMLPHVIAQRGLGRTFQLTRVFPEMTVLENLMAGPQDQRGENLLWGLLPDPRVRAEEREYLDRSREILSFLDLTPVADEYAGELSYGQQKLVELGRVLMTEPRMLLLDEPLAGVNPTLANQILDHIQTLREQGLTFLIVEHDIAAVMRLCDQVIVMDHGEVIARGAPQQVVKDPRVVDAYLGT